MNDLLTTKPVDGAVVEVFSYQQQKIQEGKTDSKGILRLDLSNRAYFAKVKKINSLLM